MVQSPSFRRLIGELDSAFVIPDEKGIKKVIYSAYDSMLPALINKININAKSVSLTIDMWTARNGQGYIGVTYSYIDAKFNFNEVTLTVTHVRYPHTAKHIMESLDKTLSEWKLHEKIFTITTDNAANMKKAISDMKNIEWQGCTAAEATEQRHHLLDFRQNHESVGSALLSSAEFHSAVPQSLTLQPARIILCSASADWKSAVRQSETLPYLLSHRRV